MPRVIWIGHFSDSPLLKCLKSRLRRAVSSQCTDSHVKNPSHQELHQPPDLGRPPVDQRRRDDQLGSVLRWLNAPTTSRALLTATLGLKSRADAGCDSRRAVGTDTRGPSGSGGLPRTRGSDVPASYPIRWPPRTERFGCTEQSGRLRHPERNRPRRHGGCLQGARPGTRRRGSH